MTALANARPKMLQGLSLLGTLLEVLQVSFDTSDAPMNLHAAHFQTIQLKEANFIAYRKPVQISRYKNNLMYRE